MPEDVVRKEMETLGICVQEVLELRSRRHQIPPLTPHFIVSVARGAEVVKLRSMTELCGLPVTVEKYIAPKGPLRCKLCQRFGRLSAAAVYETKQPTVGAV
jgi:hypothetical protein